MTLNSERTGAFALAAIALMSLTACASAPTAPAGEPARMRLQSCSLTPNCVSSESSSPLHRIEALRPLASPAIAWPALRAAALDLPGCTVVAESATYLHFECRSALLGFVDDLELLALPDGAVAVRSASRLGISDLGVNSRRVSALRSSLTERGVIAR